VTRPVPHTTTLIIGGGQAGLAMSRCLSELGLDHVVLERGQVAQRWRSLSWDSLHLLTPNWMTRLPRFQYNGADPDGFAAALSRVLADARASNLMGHAGARYARRYDWRRAAADLLLVYEEQSALVAEARA